MKLLGGSLCLQSLNIKLILITFASQLNWLNNSLFLDKFIHLANSNNLSRFIRLSTIICRLLIMYIIIWLCFKVLFYLNLFFRRFLNLNFWFYFIEFFLLFKIFLCSGHNIFLLNTFLISLILIVLLINFLKSILLISIY